MKRLILVLLASLIFLFPGCAEAPEFPQPPAAPVEKAAEAPPPEIAPEAPAAPVETSRKLPLQNHSRRKKRPHRNRQ